MFTLTFSIAVFCSCVSFIAGFIDAIAGGGGLLTIPALLISGVPPHLALGINKVSAFMGTSVALINYSLNRLVNWRMAAYGLAFSIAGSWIGSIIALHLDSSLLGKILVVLLPVAMILTLVPPKKEAVNKEVKGMTFWVGLPLICLAIGLYDGFFGPATGSFLILGLHWGLGMGLIQSSGTAKALNLGSNYSAAVSFVLNGVIFWPLALLMGFGLMAGNWFGSRMAIKIGAKAVRRFLIVSLFLLLATLIWQFFING